jgi:hypothetical protein
MESPDWHGFCLILAILLAVFPFGIWQIVQIVWYVVSHLHWVG